ncbi:MAG: exodeoxyribonuclease VII large subunit [Muribaculaceae bacterium]|nr:exodeoxyribonuclease VII large subunit [Muribaculaceae bacterium]
MCKNSPLALSALLAKVGDTLRMNPALQEVWVTADLSDVRVSGGHCYMELVEKDEISGQLLAKIRATVWSSRFRLLQGKFLNITSSDIRSGMKVMVRGTISHHNLYGISFNITDIDPSYTLGDIERQRREILQRLAADGVLELNRSLPFPAVPQKIAVISAAGAAGYGDFMDHLLNSPEGFKFYTLLVPTVMQGERTALSVMNALDFVESTLDVWDCVVIIRGGGATTDMHGFDNYDLAKRVAEFPLPVVVGIGHDRDRNVLDEIACRRCKTPTAVADFLVECCRESWNDTLELTGRISSYVSEYLHGERLRLSNIENLLPARVKYLVGKAERNLIAYASEIELLCNRRISCSSNLIEIKRLKLESVLKAAIQTPAMKLRRIEDMLRVLSPKNTLKRGYSITRVNGNAVYDSRILKKGDRITTVLNNGEIQSIVE